MRDQIFVCATGYSTTRVPTERMTEAAQLFGATVGTGGGELRWALQSTKRQKLVWVKKVPTPRPDLWSVVALLVDRDGRGYGQLAVDQSPTTFWRLSLRRDAFGHLSEFRDLFVKFAELLGSSLGWSWTSSELYGPGFTALGYLSPAREGVDLPQGYGWLNLWPDALYTQLRGQLDTVPDSRATALDIGEGGAAWLVETAHGPVPLIEELDGLDALLVGHRTSRSQRSSPGPLTPADVASFSRLDAMLTSDEVDVRTGPPWPHPDWPLDLPIDADFYPLQVEQRAKDWPSPAFRPPLEWWDRPDPVRLEPSPRLP